jgi:hypothetical protein
MAFNGSMVCALSSKDASMHSLISPNVWVASIITTFFTIHLPTNVLAKKDIN